MATSHYFNNFSPSTINEQRLLEDLIVESIKIMGHDCFYIPRTAYDSVDEIFGEINNSKFTSAYAIEAYIANVQGYEGDGDYFSKFGLEIRDNTNIVLSRRSFERYVPSNQTIRPREGDLLYVPVMQKLFEIKFVEEELMFFSLGKRNPYIYELRCELFRYSNETIDTGVEEIDVIEKETAYSIMINVTGGTGSYIDTEVVYQGANLAYATATAKVKEFDPSALTLELYNIVGKFTVNNTVRGVTSNAAYTMAIVDTLSDNNETSDFENKLIEDIADTFLVIDNNPFGSP
jgi:hypothetical protein